jgi:hypothetical protein
MGALGSTAPANLSGYLAGNGYYRIGIRLDVMAGQIS